MRILHLLADWKWTGPSEPILILTDALARRGHEVVFAVQEAPEYAREKAHIVRFAHARGVRVDTSLAWDRRTKPGNLFGAPGIVRDAWRLSGIIDELGADIVNAHSDHDHITAGLSRWFAKRRPVLVRTDHKRDSFPRGIATRFLLSRWADGVITFSPAAGRRITEAFSYPKERLLVVDPALDLSCWTLDPPAKDMRAAFGIGPDAFVIGMVARFQAYRKTDRVIAAFARLTRKHQEARLLLLGRSSQMEKSVLVPARRLGVADRVITPGHIRQDYRDALASMDAFVFMYPGSDGTARALREAMALGLPVVAARIGMLPEIVEDTVSGLVVDPTEDDIAAALDRLYSDAVLRKRLAEGARRAAVRRFDMDGQARIVEQFYESLVEDKGSERVRIGRHPNP
jgi:glycosyltransferase involved in cell wall biosynthesis